ncbi:hypothetical protein Tco_0720394 [Tanacetum coccineum]
MLRDKMISDVDVFSTRMLCQDYRDMAHCDPLNHSSLCDNLWCNNIHNLEVVFSTWMAFGGNTRDLGSFGEETDEITDLHQILEEVLLTERGDGVASIKRRRRDLFSDGVWNLETASGRGRLKEDLESST